MMENRELIKLLFNEFVDILEKDQPARLAELLTDDAALFSTNYGNAEGKQAVILALTWRGAALNYRRSRIFNFVAFASESFGRQSAVVTTLAAQNDDDYFHYFQCGGYFLNDWRFESGRWKLSRIRFNLDMEDGNTSFVRGWWKLIDYRYFEGALKYPIVSEQLAPWRVEAPEPGSEKERVLDSLYRYAWGIDHADIEILKSCFHESVGFGGSFPGYPAHLRESLTPRDLMIRFMKYKRYKEPVMEHIYKIAGVDISGDRASVQVYRYEPHRLGTQKLNRINMERDFYSGKMEYEFVRLPGGWKNGGWKMTLNTVKEMKVFSEESNAESRFY